MSDRRPPRGRHLALAERRSMGHCAAGVARAALLDGVHRLVREQPIACLGPWAVVPLAHMDVPPDGKGPRANRRGRGRGLASSVHADVREVRPGRSSEARLQMEWERLARRTRSRRQRSRCLWPRGWRRRRRHQTPDQPGERTLARRGHGRVVIRCLSGVDRAAEPGRLRAREAHRPPACQPGSQRQLPRLPTQQKADSLASGAPM
jgi:hypothetical protein